MDIGRKGNYISLKQMWLSPLCSQHLVHCFAVPLSTQQEFLVDLQNFRPPKAGSVFVFPGPALVHYSES